MDIEVQSAVDPEPANEGEKFNCDSCRDDQDQERCSTAVKYCIDCQQNLCETCNAWHSKIKASKTHRLRSPLKQQIILSTNSAPSEFCARHAQDKLSVNCNTCDVVICSVCLVTEHNGHAYEEVTELSKKIRDKLREKITYMAESILDVQAKCQELTAELKYAVSDTVDGEERIKQRCQEIKNQIAEFKEQLLSDSARYEIEASKAIQERLNDLESQAKLVENCAGQLEELKNNGTHIDVILKEKELLPDAEKLLAGSKTLLNLKSKPVRHSFYASSEDFTSSSIGENKIEGMAILIFGPFDGENVLNKMIRISVTVPDKVDVSDAPRMQIGKGSALCHLDGDMYIVGAGQAFDELWQWTSSIDEWGRCADMKTGRQNHCVTVVDKKIYMMGGWSSKTRKVIPSIAQYDPETDKWTSMANLVHSAESSTCVAFGSSIFVFGGRGKGGLMINCVQIYDTVTKQIKIGQNSMPYYNNGSVRAVLWGSKALLVGRAHAYIYDCLMDTWQARDAFEIPKVRFGFSIDKDTLYVFGGGEELEPKKWKFSDEILSLSVHDFITDNRNSGWKHHAKLSMPAAISTYTSVPILLI